MTLASKFDKSDSKTIISLRKSMTHSVALLVCYSTYMAKVRPAGRMQPSHFVTWKNLKKTQHRPNLWLFLQRIGTKNGKIRQIKWLKKTTASRFAKKNSGPMQNFGVKFGPQTKKYDHPCYMVKSLLMWTFQMFFLRRKWVGELPELWLEGRDEVEQVLSQGWRGLLRAGLYQHIRWKK